MSKDAYERMERAQELYEEIVADNERIEEFIQSFDGMRERMDRMGKYYEDQWLEDTMALEKAGESIQVMNQDAIYEEIAEQYNKVKRIIFMCADYIRPDK